MVPYISCFVKFAFRHLLHELLQKKCLFKLVQVIKNIVETVKQVLFWGFFVGGGSW